MSIPISRPPLSFNCSRQSFPTLANFPQKVNPAGGDLLIDTNQKASEALRPFKLYPQKLVNINIKTKKPLDKIVGLEAKLKELDEINIRHLIRYSGTENKLRVLLECKEGKKMNFLMDDMVEFFQKALNA